MWSYTMSACVYLHVVGFAIACNVGIYTVIIHRDGAALRIFIRSGLPSNPRRFLRGLLSTISRNFSPGRVYQ